MRPFIAILPLLLVAGCALRVAEQEIYARHHQDDDSLELLLIYKQVHHNPDDKDALKKCIDIVERTLGGRREFWLKGFFGRFDLDDEDGKSELSERQRALVDGVTIDDYGIFLDEEERLCGYQRIRFPHIAEGVKELNAALSKEIIKSVEEGAPKDDDSPLDDRSYTLIEERARSGKPWFRLIDGEIELDLPFTRASWDALHKQLLLGAVAVPDEASGHEIAQILGHLRHLNIDAERVTIRFGAPDGLFRFVFHDEDAKYTHDLKNALEKKGVSFEDLPGIEEVRKKIR